MNAASKRQDFELALKLRNKITSFERYINTHSFSNKRILSYHSADSAILSLKQLLIENYKLKITLNRIEAYDASHSAFSDAVVAMVVATDGELNRGEYRRFHLKRTNQSDFDQLEEALIRRFRNNWPRPDLLVIDGGSPQLRKLQRVLDQLDNPPLMIGLAKHPDHLILPYEDSPRRHIKYVSVNLPLNDPGLNLLQSLRDEAHRFGNQYRLILEKKSKSTQK